MRKARDGSGGMKTVHFVPSGAKFAKIPVAYLDSDPLAVSPLVASSKMAKARRTRFELLRRTYDLSMVQADLALYQQWHGAAIQFFETIRKLEESYAAIIGCAKQAGDYLSPCCDGNCPPSTASDDQLRNLRRFHDHYHQALECHQDSLDLHRKYRTSIEQARTRFETARTRFETNVGQVYQEYVELEGP